MSFCPLIKEDCKGKKCMMYYEEGDACSINCIAAFLEEMSNQLEEIKDGACDPVK